MFLHLGGNVTVPMNNVIAIISTKSKITQEFLKTAAEEGFVEKTSEDRPKTIVITEADKKSKVFLSPISSATLYKRVNFIEEISNL
jgi:regulator of extracellular matrix RemA (YlzA/DUF370 family)